MKKLFGIFVLGLIVNVVGCGDDDNPVKSSNQDLLVGTWMDEYEESITFRSDGTFVDGDGDEGTWTLVGDQLTISYNDEAYGSGTVRLNSVTDTEFTVTDEDGDRYVSTRKTSGDDDSNTASSSVSSDNFAETILGLWKSGGEPIWTFNADGTLVFDGYEELNYYWSIEGSTLTITDADGNVFAVYEINSLTSEQFVYAEADYPDVKNTQTR